VRRIPTSGGLEFGPEGGPWIDVIPLPSRPPVRPEEVGRIAKDGLSWQRWNRKAVRELGLPVLVPAGMGGVIGLSGVHQASIRFLWRRGQSPSEALQEIEEAEGHLPPALAGAVLAAAQAQEYPVVYAPSAVAMVCDLLPAGGPTRYSRRDIQGFVEQFLNALAGEQADVSMPGGATDRARFWLQVARRLWDPRVRRRLAEAALDLENRLIVTVLAAAWAELKRIERVEVAGIRLHVSAPPGAWPHLVEWEQSGIPHRVLDFLVGHEVPNGALTLFYLADAVAGRSGLPAVSDEDLARGLVEAFLEDAEKNAAYAPAGDFVLILPEEYPLRRGWDVTALRVWADPEGLWVAGLDHRERPVFALRWRPGVSLSTSWVVAGDAALLLEVTLAALWRDLRVAGEEAVPSHRPQAPAGRRPRPPSRTAGRKAGRKPGRRVYSLPRRRRRDTRRLSLGGVRTWGTRDDHAYVQEAREVPGHTRRLPPGWKASEEAKRRAHLAGIILPENRTYVRPHPRRVWVRADSQGNEPQPRAREVKARGLVTVMVMMQKWTGGKNDDEA